MSKKLSKKLEKILDERKPGMSRTAEEKLKKKFVKEFKKLGRGPTCLAIGKAIGVADEVLTHASNPAERHRAEFLLRRAALVLSTVTDLDGSHGKQARRIQKDLEKLQKEVPLEKTKAAERAYRVKVGQISVALDNLEGDVMEQCGIPTSVRKKMGR